MKSKFLWLNPKLEFRKTDKYEKGGRGTFTKKNIKKGECVLIAGGYIMTLDEEAKLPYPLNDYGMQISENLVLCIKNKGETNGLNFFNHSCDPNVGIAGQIYFVAMRDIKTNEEIVFDYAMVLYHSVGSKPYKMKCLCDSKNCRGIITDNDWKIKELQKRYKNHFQYYLLEKMKP